MRLTHRLALAALLLGNLPAGWAAEPVTPPQLTLQASASEEVRQDLAFARLQIISEGTDANTVMQDANRKLNAVLKQLKQYPALEVHNDGYTTQPRYQRDQSIRGWQVTAGVQIKTRDSAQLTQAIAQLGTQASLNGLWFDLATETRKKVEKTLLQQAIGNLQDKATLAAQAAGFKRTELRELNIGETAAPGPRPFLARSAMAMSEAAAGPDIEAGSQRVEVTVSASLWLYK